MTSISPPRAAPKSAIWLRLEAPTWLLCAAIYGGWFLLTVNYHALPWWVVLALGAWLAAWHNSLQHEIVHGHPTRRRRLNEALAYAPLGLVIAYPFYRTSHLRHHATAALSCPRRDPESELQRRRAECHTRSAPALPIYSRARFVASSACRRKLKILRGT
ncbi:MAG: fatty acid desaturase [Alphaproteobacteria bacterium]|nr:fatty acid desaturase [Alphaproteobacteria bacterium]MDP6590082.1 fatty acid desaturase [Alphaproteobacteria bacterium]MDP6819486.1 fatty acid desaturase [Alphaproteobacteria bacterium]